MFWLHEKTTSDYLVISVTCSGVSKSNSHSPPRSNPARNINRIDRSLLTVVSMLRSKLVRDTRRSRAKDVTTVRTCTSVVILVVANFKDLDGCSHVWSPLNGRQK